MATIQRTVKPLSTNKVGNPKACDMLSIVTDVRSETARYICGDRHSLSFCPKNVECPLKYKTDIIKLTINEVKECLK